jgi:hypothetical protein
MSYAHNLAIASSPFLMAEKVWTVLVVAMLLVAAGYGFIILNHIVHSFDLPLVSTASANHIAGPNGEAAPRERRKD